MQCREKTARGKVLEIALRLLCKTYSTDTAACRDERCALLRNTSWGTVSIVAVRGETAAGQTDIVSPVATLPLLCTALALCALCTVPHSPCSALETVVLNTICSELDSALFCGTLLYHTFITFADHLEPADPAFGQYAPPFWSIWPFSKT